MINKENLLALADFLETVPPERFNYTIWAEGLNLGECGTQGCALGWACTMPRFQALGLHLVKSSEDGIFPTVAPPDEVPFNGFFGEAIDEVGEKLFGLDTEQVNELFIPTGRERDFTPHQVAAKIRHFVEANS